MASLAVTAEGKTRQAGGRWLLAYLPARRRGWVQIQELGMPACRSLEERALLPPRTCSSRRPICGPRACQ